MKILYLYQYFGTPNGSWSTRVYEMCKVWIEQGAEVTVITSPYDKSDLKTNKLISRLKIDGINLIVINAGDSNRYSMIKRAYKALIFAIISTYYSVSIKCNVLIASSGPITIGIPGLLGKLLSNKSLVFEVRDLWPGGAVEMGLIQNRFLKRIFIGFEKLCYRHSSLVVPCSIGMESNILNRYPKVDTLVIPNACDNKLFQGEIKEFDFPDWVNHNSKIFLYTGSLGLMDACDEIIHGFNLVKDKFNTHIVFIGDGTERKLLENLVEKYCLNDNIHFLGLIPKTQVIQWYTRALASFVVFKDFPILSTSSPNKMFDSFAAGVPIIQNTVGWISDLVSANKIGLNVESEDPISMKIAIERFIDNRVDLALMKNNVRSMANNEFDRSKLALKYLEHLSRLN